MKARLISGYRGVLTEERFYPPGDYSVPDDMPEEHAQRLADAGRAELIKPRVRRSRKKAQDDD